MNAQTTSVSAAASALLLVLLVACEGPAGPEGPMGNANVQSDSVTLSNSDWESGRIYFQTASNSSISRSARIATLDVPAISEEIKSSGLVKVYFKTIEGFGNEPSVWTSLPYSILAFGSEYSYNLNYSYDTGAIKLYYYYRPNSSDVTAPNVDDAELPDYKFKYVVASEDAASSVSAARINTDSHGALVQFLNERFDAGIEP